jgi:RecQ family ATP-dependent DNA helicase
MSEDEVQAEEDTNEITNDDILGLLESSRSNRSDHSNHSQISHEYSDQNAGNSDDDPGGNEIEQDYDNPLDQLTLDIEGALSDSDHQKEETQEFDNPVEGENWNRKNSSTAWDDDIDVDEIANYLSDDEEPERVYEEAQDIDWSTRFSWEDTITSMNKEIFNQDSFWENQREIINATKSRRDVLALIPTGGGKSLTFQIAAFSDSGYTIVVMPLISLINDQIMGLEKMTEQYKGYFYSSDFHDGFFTTLYTGRDPALKLIYLTPEKIVNNQAFQQVLTNLYHKNRIDRFVIDEAHWVSIWGQDFRKDYLELKILKEKFPRVPILALTATATPKVKKDVIEKLKLKNVVQFQSSFNRPNLFYEIVEKDPKTMNEKIAKFIKTKFPYESGIIYCLSKKECQEVTFKLQSVFKIKWDYYHADMNDNKRYQVQRRWMNGEIQIVVATIAFGMGINKNNVRFVIHTSLPKSLENYTQEWGRAGRDGKPAHWTLFYCYNDRRRLEYFIVSNKETSMERKNENLHSIYKILEFWEEPLRCRRKLLLKYLDEQFKTKECHRNWDNWMKNIKTKEINFENESKTVINFIQDISHRNFNLTITQAADYLKGKDIPRLSRMIDLKKNYFKKLWYIDFSVIKRIIIRLLILKVLKEKFIQMKDNSKQIHSFIAVGRNTKQFLTKNMKLYLSCPHERKYKSKFEDVILDESVKGEISVVKVNSNECQKANYSEEVDEEPIKCSQNNFECLLKGSVKEGDSNEIKLSETTSKMLVTDELDEPSKNSYFLAESTKEQTKEFSKAEELKEEKELTEPTPISGNKEEADVKENGSKVATKTNSQDVFKVEKSDVGSIFSRFDKISKGSLFAKKSMSQETPMLESKQNRKLQRRKRKRHKIEYIALNEYERDELYERILVVRTRIMNEVDPQRKPKISKTLSHKFISFLTAIVPRDLKDLTGNEMIKINERDVGTLKLYGHLLFAEINHFLKSIRYKNEKQYDNTTKKKSEKSLSVKLASSSSQINTNSDHKEVLLIAEDTKDEKNKLEYSDKSSSDSDASQMGIMNNQLEDGYISPLELNENYTGKINFSVLDEIIKPKPAKKWSESVGKVDYKKKKPLPSIHEVVEETDEDEKGNKMLVKKKSGGSSWKTTFLLPSNPLHTSSQNMSKLQMSINKCEKEINKKASDDLQAALTKPKTIKTMKRVQKQIKKNLSEASSVPESDDEDYAFEDDDIPQNKKKKAKKAFL